jgi:hypothetical protein
MLNKPLQPAIAGRDKKGNSGSPLSANTICDALEFRTLILTKPLPQTVTLKVTRKQNFQGLVRISSLVF